MEIVASKPTFSVHLPFLERALGEQSLSVQVVTEYERMQWDGNNRTVKIQKMRLPSMNLSSYFKTFCILLFLYDVSYSQERAEG